MPNSTINPPSYIAGWKLSDRGRPWIDPQACLGAGCLSVAGRISDTGVHEGKPALAALVASAAVYPTPWCHTGNSQIKRQVTELANDVLFVKTSVRQLDVDLVRQTLGEGALKCVEELRRRVGEWIACKQADRNLRHVVRAAPYRNEPDKQDISAGKEYSAVRLVGSGYTKSCNAPMIMVKGLNR